MSKLSWNVSKWSRLEVTIEGVGLCTNEKCMGIGCGGGVFGTDGEGSDGLEVVERIGKFVGIDKSLFLPFLSQVEDGGGGAGREGE